ncbi:MAG: lamin tail domain-containing protein, partial [Bradyrhizobium sp.]
GLYIKAGTTFDFENKQSYAVTVNVNDPTVGGTPDASTNFNLSVSDVINEGGAPTLFISEVAPWSSGNAPAFGRDWFEVTNTGTTAIDITGWKVDDNSDNPNAALALRGITSIAPGESVIFMETSTADGLAAAKAAFIALWFGGNAPAGLQIGNYSGSGIGLSSDGDHVNLFDSHGVLQANVTFGASPAGPNFATFANDAGLNNAALTGLSVVGDNGAFLAAADPHETGSPGVQTGVVNDKPIFTSAASFDIAENQTAVGAVAAVDPEHDSLTFGLAGGDDKDFFTIDSHTGAFRFVASPDFETRADANHDNVYDLTVSATDNFGHVAMQTVQVHVTDVTEIGKTFAGGNGNDALAGTNGDDTMTGANGDDALNGGDGNDTISGGNGNDALLGGRGDDVLDGANGNDVLDGGAGNNRLSGGNGDDRLMVGTGDNLLTGGNGNDTFVFSPGFGKNVVTDFSHGDVIAFGSGAFANFAAVQAAMHVEGNDVVIGLDPAHSVTLQGVSVNSLHASDFLFV